MQKKNKSVVVVIFVLAVVVAAGGSLFLYKDYTTKQKAIAEAAELQKHREAAVKEYEDILTAFVQDIAKEVKIYKQQRSILKEVLKPHNFSTPEYAKQNYEEFKNQILPVLQRQSSKVLNIFDLTGAKLDQLLEQKPEETRLFLRTKWLAMRDKEQVSYNNFFDADVKLLAAYEELLRFYYVKAKGYTVKEDALVFQNPEDQKAEEELKKIIQNMQKSDKALQAGEEKKVKEQKSMDVKAPIAQP